MGDGGSDSSICQPDGGQAWYEFLFPDASSEYIPRYMSATVHWVVFFKVKSIRTKESAV